jgi:hypothetical protein
LLESAERHLQVDNQAIGGHVPGSDAARTKVLPESRPEFAMAANFPEAFSAVVSARYPR